MLEVSLERKKVGLACSDCICACDIAAGIGQHRVEAWRDIPESNLIVVHVIQEGSPICGGGEGVPHCVPHPACLMLLSRNLHA